MLKSNCLKCVKCSLHKNRTQVVFGEGNKNSKILFVGEGPGVNEDIEGRPFVGRSGELLDSMLKDIGLSRDKDIYISNIVKCRPPDNRDPLPEEQEMCIQWLRNQFYLMKPKIIVALGRIASLKIVDINIKITKDHGIFKKKNNVWMIPMFHPAAILRNMKNKIYMQKDFLNLKNKIQELEPFLIDSKTHIFNRLPIN